MQEYVQKIPFTVRNGDQIIRIKIDEMIKAMISNLDPEQKQTFQDMINMNLCTQINNTYKELLSTCTDVPITSQGFFFFFMINL